MKAFAICAVVGAGVFLAGLLPLGVLNTGLGRGSNSSSVEIKAAPESEVPRGTGAGGQGQGRGKSRCLQARPDVSQDGLHDAGRRIHTWHESIPEDWQADTVEETELVVVVAKQKKIQLSRVPRVLIGTNTPAPPMDRVRYDVEVSVIEAKTGNILDNRIFRNEPRRYRNPEPYATTTIGSPVHISKVFQWVSEKSKTGFPPENDMEPVVMRID